MKVAVTGGTGFVDSHLAGYLAAKSHKVVLLARHASHSVSRNNMESIPCNIANEGELTQALTGCEAVAHCAGINREIGEQTYEKVHVEGTRCVVEASQKAGIKKIALVSFLRARPECGSTYHETKWAAEELVRNSGLDYTVLKPGIIYGRGDHMLSHLSQTIKLSPIFGSVGRKGCLIRPLAVEDMAHVLSAAIVEGRLGRQTVTVMGPETMRIGEAARRVASVLGRKILVFPMPLWSHFLLAWIMERTMKVPIIALSQVRMFSEGIVEATPPCDELPPDLQPKTHFTVEQIRRGLP